MMTSTSDLATDKITADIDIIADGTGTTRVTIILRTTDGPSTVYLVLSKADYLAATAGDTEKTMTGMFDFGRTTYTTTFDTDTENTTFTVSFNRDHKTTAPYSTASLPEGFTLESPHPSQEFSRSTDDIPIIWTPSATTDEPDTMRLIATGNCANGRLFTISRTIADDGEEVIESGEVSKEFDAITGSCSLTIEVRRSRTGTVDPHFGSGTSINAYHTRSVSVISKP